MQNFQSKWRERNWKREERGEGRVNGEGMRLNNGSVLILRNVARKGGETETQRLE